ncbi:hypothetical protein QI633_11265 [Nocardioides sp. QY071]|uniref:hypothetical protein n=1 Tax=Nocardioides sp. QY071 TaxID=3044187 RepID=UPI00249C6EA8|nr:hypothetical protein [Nocardioides sp. QY071]WGY04325.1 hypothetical protein QI633_11265 [Nocardioides sp. QY071]
MPAITDEVAAKAMAIHDKLNATLARVRGNKDLNDDGRLRQLAKAYTDAKVQLTSLREQFEGERAATVTKLNREIFGATSVSGADAISLRDAADRASQITDPADALRLVQQANDTGDEVLARAIAQVAHRNHAGFLGAAWAPVLEAFLAERPVIAARLTQLEGATTGGLQSDFQMEGHFYLAEPYEFAQVPPGRIAAYAAEPEPAPKRSLYEEMRQQLGHGPI